MRNRKVSSTRAAGANPLSAGRPLRYRIGMALGKSAWNERVKLLANLLQSIATSTIGVGIIAPLAAALYNPGSIRPNVSLGFAIVVVAANAAACHLAAQAVLGRIRE